MGDAQSAAEGSTLGAFKYQLMKAKEKQSPTATLSLSAECDGKDKWQRGAVIANAQNWART